MHFIRTLVIQDKLVSIERRAYILDGSIQAVYKYWIDDMLVLTFFTNGQTTNLYPVYHKLDIWPKQKLDDLLAGMLPIDNDHIYSSSRRVS
jgi:hypothetical protein